MIVPGMFVCSSFLISVCMFIVSKALLISSATVIIRVGGAIWLNVVFLYPCCMGVFWYVCMTGFHQSFPRWPGLQFHYPQYQYDLGIQARRGGAVILENGIPYVHVVVVYCH